MRFLFVAVLSGCLGACSHVPASSAPSQVRLHSSPARLKNVAFVDASQWNDAGNQPWTAPSVVKLTESDVAALPTVIASLPSFPPNPYSGCHARAELVYRALEKRFPGKAFKVWVFSGELLSPAMNGSISFTMAGGVKTSWKYHVAAAVQDAAGSTLVIDSLVTAKPLSVNNWLEHFDIAGLAVVTETPGSYYLFNKTQVEALDPKKYPDGFRVGVMTRNVFNGNTYGYTGNAADTHDGARDLAADAVIAKFLAGQNSDCEWARLVDSSIKLKAAIAQTDLQTAPPACKEVWEEFTEQVAHWSSKGL
jgi:hypothetical protein